MPDQHSHPSQAAEQIVGAYAATHTISDADARILIEAIYQTLLAAERRGAQRAWEEAAQEASAMMGLISAGEILGQKFRHRAAALEEGHG